MFTSACKSAFLQVRVDSNTSTLAVSCVNNNTINLLKRVTFELVDTYRSVRNNAIDEQSHSPRTTSNELILLDTTVTKESSSQLGCNDVVDGRYRLLRAIGEGTFSQLFEAEYLHDSTRRRVALKAMNTNFSFIGEHEYNILRRLYEQHIHATNCHIIKIIDAFVAGHHFCMVMELLGPSLLSTLHAQDTFSIPVLQKITFQIGLALACLHRSQLIHTDLKPENILLSSCDDKTRSSHITLIDFGNALLFTERNVYFEDFELQSLFYRAPEIAIGSFSFDFAIDMWSLGCVLIELYSGKAVFRVQNSRDLLYKIQSILGHFPLDRFGQAKFFKRYSVDSCFQSIDTPITLSQRRQRIASLLGTNNQDFVSLIESLLAFDPTQRLSAMEMLQHPFLQSLVPLAFLLAPQKMATSPLLIDTQCNNIVERHDCADNLSLASSRESVNECELAAKRIHDERSEATIDDTNRHKLRRLSPSLLLGASSSSSRYRTLSPTFTNVSPVREISLRENQGVLGLGDYFSLGPSSGTSSKRQRDTSVSVIPVVLESSIFNSVQSEYDECNDELSRRRKSDVTQRQSSLPSMRHNRLSVATSNRDNNIQSDDVDVKTHVESNDDDIILLL